MTGTITANEDFDAERSCLRFRKAMKGLGTDFAVITRETVTHDNLQRQMIREAYKKHGRDLIKDLKEELGGTYADTILAMFESPYDLVVSALHYAFRNAGTNEKALTDLLCCRTSEELASLKERYEKRYNKTLDDQMESELSGEFQLLMRSLVAADRDQSQTVDAPKAKNDAQMLYDAGVGVKSEDDTEDFITIFNTRSYAQLQETFEEYHRLAGQPIEDAIDTEFSGDMRKGLLAIVQRVRDPLGFYAERLNQTMAGLGTDDKALIRIIVSRSEIDLADIKECYKEKYDKELADDVRDDTSGEYQKLLLAIINN
ncbi:annexin A5-like [Portunus trituberculatus]|uniref:annexin A5-like n=1 Tax=Portunus trituberculatus TaxID=210409 RepID=UPI001E1CF57C|nr:annexin A5-like [Portunus trituberculatus]